MSDVIGVDLGGTKIAVARLAGRELAGSTLVPTDLSSSDALIDQLASLVEKCRGDELDGVGIGDVCSHGYRPH